MLAKDIKMLKSRSYQNLMDNKRKSRPLSQSLSINNLHGFSLKTKATVKADTKPVPSKITNIRNTENSNMKSIKSTNIKSTNTKSTNTKSTNLKTTNTIPSTNIKTTNTNTNTKSSMNISTDSKDVTVKSSTIKRRDMKEEKRKKRFSIISFIQPDSDSSPESIMDNKIDIDLQPIEMDDDTSIESEYDISIELKKRTSNLSNIMEFIDLINYGDVKRRLIKLESSTIEEFNQGDYKVKPVSSMLLFGYEHQPQTLDLDDIDYWSEI